MVEQDLLNGVEDMISKSVKIYNFCYITCTPSMIAGGDVFKECMSRCLEKMEKEID